MFRGYSIDVKGRSKRWHDMLMVPEHQWRKRQYDFYIGCNQWEKDVIRFWGYATKKEIQDVTTQDFGYGPTHAMLLMDLHPVKELLQLEPKNNEMAV